MLPIVPDMLGGTNPADAPEAEDPISSPEATDEGALRRVGITEVAEHGQKAGERMALVAAGHIEQRIHERDRALVVAPIPDRPDASRFPLKCTPRRFDRCGIEGHAIHRDVLAEAFQRSYCACVKT